ncbi:MAG: ABC transporter permease [Deltaproteobacteria bacterium]|nr:ABC transporter permease [Deltaproteobacteria bacterium]
MAIDGARTMESTPDGPAEFFRLCGRSVVRLCNNTGEVTMLGVATLRAIFRYRWDMGEIFHHCFFIGNRSLGIVFLISVFTGMVLSLQFIVGLSRFGLTLYTGQIVGLSITRELGPVLTSLMVAARVGSGIAAELGSMVVTEQVLAIQAMGANPIQKLVVPRAIATLISVPLLTVFADAVGVLGGMIVTTMETNVTAQFYLHQIWTTVALDDYLHGIAKTVVFAGCIVLIACHQGLRTYGGTAGVGRSTTRAVVFASVAIFIADFLLTKLLIVL